MSATQARSIDVLPNGMQLPSLQIGTLRITLCDDPALVEISCAGEGGQFSAAEFREAVGRFVGDRL